MVKFEISTAFANSITKSRNFHTVPLFFLETKEPYFIAEFPLYRIYQFCAISFGAYSAQTNKCFLIIFLLIILLQINSHIHFVNLCLYLFTSLVLKLNTIKRTIACTVFRPNVIVGSACAIYSFHLL